MIRRFFTLIFVIALSGLMGTGVGILIAPMEGAETRERMSEFIDEHGSTLVEGLEQSGRVIGSAIKLVTARVASDKNETD
jgi:hypothetical protein